MNIAALVDNLSVSQSSFYMIKNFNKLIEEAKHSACCFYANLSVAPTKAMFSTMNLTENNSKKRFSRCVDREFLQ